MNYSSGGPDCKGNAGIPALDLFFTALASGMRPSLVWPRPRNGVGGGRPHCARALVTVVQRIFPVVCSASPMPVHGA